MRPSRLLLFVSALAPLVCGAPYLNAQNSKENADFKLAMNLYNDGLYDLALEQFKQFISSYPTTSQGIDARFTMGLAQLKLKKYEDARMTFQTFALTYQDHPKAPDAWWNVGESYAAVNNYREAALAFERVKVFHPRSKLAAEALLKASEYFLLAGERDNARKSLRIILQEYPTSGAVAAARTHLGQLYFEEGNLEQAQSELKRVIESDPSPDAKAGALLLLANISSAMGRRDNAQTDYQEIITKYKSSTALQGAHVGLGKLCADEGRPAEALDHFKRALAEKTVGDSLLVREATIGLADAQAALNDNNAAVASYEKYLAANPQDVHAGEVLWKLASAAGKAKNYRKSGDACARILKSDASPLLKQRARLKLALNAQEQKNSSAAIQNYEAFVDAFADHPLTPAIALRIADVNAQELHDYRKAAVAYEQVAARYPASPVADDALAGAALSYEKLKEFDRALELDKELIAKYPASEFRSSADERVRMIEIFEAKEREAGMEKLAVLVGDVVTEKDKAPLAYQLGEIYFTDLKNYAAAATQFTNAIEQGLTDARAVDAFFKKAQCLEYLSWKDPHMAPQAVAAYRGFLAAQPPPTQAEAARLAVFRLSATSLPAARQAAATLYTESPSFARTDVVDLTLGKYLEGSDSLAAAASSYATAEAHARDPLVAEESMFRRFTLLMKLQQADSARAQGDRFISAFPSGPHVADVLTALGDLALAQDDPHGAVEYYQHLINDFPYAAPAEPARRKLADALAAAGDSDSALAAYSELYQRQSSDPWTDGKVDPQILLAIGRLHREAGNMQESKRYLLAALSYQRTGPIAGQAYTLLGFIAKSEGRTDVATSYFRQAEIASPGAAVTGDVAELLFDSGDYADAIKYYSQLSASARSDSDRQYFDAQIIIARFRTNDPARAEKEIAAFLGKYKETTDDQGRFELEKGNFYFRREDYANALKSFRRVADKFEDSPSAPPALYWIGKTLEATGKQKEAIDHLENVLTTHPHAPIIPRVHFALGNLYYGVEKWSEAINNYRFIVDDPKADPELLPLAISNLIETYEIAGAYDGALALARKYLDLYPNAEDALDKRIKIGILYDRLGYYDQAVLHLQSLLDEAGSDLEGEIRYYIGEANYNKGDYQQAILDFLKVPYLVTKKGKLDWTANALYMSGQSYEKMGRYDQALTMYQQIVDRPGIDETFKSAARKEIDRVKTVLKRKAN